MVRGLEATAFSHALSYAAHTEVRLFCQFFNARQGALSRRLRGVLGSSSQFVWCSLGTTSEFALTVQVTEFLTDLMK